MADFCFQCNIDLFFGPHSDFEGLITEEEVKQGLGALVLCEGCGPCRVDHRGWCIDTDCLGRHSHISPEAGKVYESAARWAAGRSGPLGPVLRFRDRFLGSPWDPGLIHFTGTWPWYVYELFLALWEGRQMQQVMTDDDWTFEAWEPTDGQAPLAAGVEAPSQDTPGPAQSGVVRNEDL